MEVLWVRVGRRHETGDRRQETGDSRQPTPDSFFGCYILWCGMWALILNNNDAT
ncbi:MAG: hypothetical protein F6K24_46240 [Okeania sp. SIO2D1]|nr:hypothetical protein [Okeania sp. SIO2D1]